MSVTALETDVPKDNVLVLLGFRDPEMDRIVAVLEELNIPHQYATCHSDEITPGTAYQADLPSGIEGKILITVECGLREQPPGLKTVPIDHHSYRYDDPSEGGREASIIQICDLFRYKPTEDDYVLAVVDDNLQRGLKENGKGRYACVTPEKVRARRIYEMAKAHNRSVEDVEKEISNLTEEFDRLPEFLIGTQKVKNGLSLDLGQGYSIPLLAIQLVAAERRTPLVIKIAAPEEKAMLYAADPETINGLLDKLEKENIQVEGSLVDPYRGYAFITFQDGGLFIVNQQLNESPQAPLSLKPASREVTAVSLKDSSVVSHLEPPYPDFSTFFEAPPLTRGL